MPLKLFRGTEGKDLKEWNKWRPTAFSPFSGNYKIECPECGETYKANIPDLKGKVSCPECGSSLEYKFF